MARRADHTREELRELALEAGNRSLEKSGYKNLSARGVANEIGYTVGTIYNVFGSLDNFIFHLNARTLDLWYEQVLEDLAKKRGDSIHNLAKGHIKFCRNHFNRWSALYQHVPRSSIKTPKWYASKRRELFRLLETALLPYTKNNKNAARRSASILWAGIHGICVLSLAGKLEVTSIDSPEVLAKDFVNNFLRGLKRS